MRTTTTVLATLVGLSLVAAACADDETSSSAPASIETSATDTMVDDTMVDDTMVDETMVDETMTDDTMTDDTMVDEMMLAPWQQLSLTDVEGNEFTLADFMGTPVLVEHFATWCSNCREQLADTDAAAAELGDQAVVIALSVETDLSPADVAAYAADNGFTHVRFAVMTPEFLAAVSDHFGNDSINPPSTPHFVIDAHGVPGALMTGSSDAADLVDAVHAAAM